MTLAATPATATPSAAPHAGPPVCARELVSHRAYLVRFARRKLRDPMLAEDLVHDVFEAVLTGRAAFAGRSALRSWLTGILKHKIVDLVRRDAGTDSYDDLFDGESAATPACTAPRPDELAEQRQWLALTLARIQAMPAGLRDVMQMRVLEDLPTGEVCQRLAISEANLFVRLHRARRQLLS
jgi:RNA polymerase sigma-70 factor (ECF subfamily)